MGGLGLDRTGDFQKFCGSGLIGSGLDSDWKFSQSAHLWLVTAKGGRSHFFRL